MASLWERMHRTGSRADRLTSSTAHDLVRRQVRHANPHRVFPTSSQWRQLPHLLSKRESWFLQGALAVLFISLIGLGWSYFQSHKIETPTVGGAYVEGLVGQPQYLNPLFSDWSDTDRDLTRLIYSGLTKKTPEGDIAFDLAEKITVSEDGKTYLVTLREDLTFHDGEPLTSEDLFFTFNTLQNVEYRSPLAQGFQGVTLVQGDPRTATFQLPAPDPLFLRKLTFGVLPSHIWGNLAPQNMLLAEYAIKPIGSGPYRFAEFTQDRKGVIQTYVLERNDTFYGTGPLLEQLTFKFYENGERALEALRSKQVEGIGFAPSASVDQLAKNRDVELVEGSTHRLTTIVFNTAKSVFKRPEIRRAVALALDPSTLIETARATTTLTEADSLLFLDESEKRVTSNLEEANKRLDEWFPWQTGAPYRSFNKTVKWKEGVSDDVYALSLELRVVDEAGSVALAEQVREQLKQAGIIVRVVVTDAASFQTSVLKTADYDLLLTTLEVGPQTDISVYWQSSQAKEGGLNLSRFSNQEADRMLKELVTLPVEKRADTLKQLHELLTNEVPALPLYRTSYLYPISAHIHGVRLGIIETLADRFQGVTSWYSETEQRLP